MPSINRNGATASFVERRAQQPRAENLNAMETKTTQENSEACAGLAAATGSAITVRFVNDTQTGKCWFEEKLTNGQWVDIPETRMSCEDNARYTLAQVIERRRQNRLMIFRKYGAEQTFTIG